MGHCPNPADITKGATLFLGAFDPEFPTSTTTPDQEPQQNFTVIVPGSLTPGRTAQLTVTHLALVGVSGFPFFFWRGTLTRRFRESLQASDTPLIEVKNVTLKVVPDS